MLGQRRWPNIKATLVQGASRMTCKSQSFQFKYTHHNNDKGVYFQKNAPAFRFQEEKKGLVILMYNVYSAWDVNSMPHCKGNFL